MTEKLTANALKKHEKKYFWPSDLLTALFQYYYFMFFVSFAKLIRDCSKDFALLEPKLAVRGSNEKNVFDIRIL